MLVAADGQRSGRSDFRPPLSVEEAMAWIADSESVEITGALVLLESDLESAILQRLIEGERIIPIGDGIYARARRSRFSDRLIPTGGFAELIRAVANRFGREIVPCPETIAYNEGRSTQVPTGRYQEMSGPPLRIELRIGGDGPLVEIVAPGDR